MGRLSRFFYYDYPFFRHVCEKYEWWRVFDFTVLNGAFGQINAAGDTAVSFRGSGGMGAKDGFLFALELAPSVILSLGIISVTEGLGGYVRHNS